MFEALIIRTGRRHAESLRAFGEDAAADKLEREVDHEEAIVADRAINASRDFRRQMDALSGIAGMKQEDIDQMVEQVQGLRVEGRAALCPGLAPGSLPPLAAPLLTSSRRPIVLAKPVSDRIQPRAQERPLVQSANSTRAPSTGNRLPTTGRILSHNALRSRASPS
jgi:hypothetical protein